MKNTKIAWATHTANLWHGCQKVHAGCDHCYAEAQDNRFAPARGSHWGPHAPRMAVKGVWKDLDRFQEQAAAAGEMHRVFVGSMMDIFEKPFPLVDAKGEPITFTPPGQEPVQLTTGDLRNRLFNEISHSCYPNLLFLLLTKRPGNILKYIPDSWKTTPPANVMYGCSVVNQETADRYIPELLQVPGRRFLSMEPLLGPVDLFNIQAPKDPEDPNEKYFFDALNENGGYVWEFEPGRFEAVDGPTHYGIDWVIVGGESGHHARPMHPDWARSIRDQCLAAGVPFFFKQWGEHALGSSGKAPSIIVLSNGWNDSYGKNPANVKDWDRNNWHALAPTTMSKVGKAAAGRLLDGLEWSQLPTI